MVGYCEYLTINWFDDDAKFPIESWNHYNNRGLRTNNHIEGYNLKLKLFLKSHPNIWKFILKIKEEESNIALRFTHLKNGTLKQKPRSSKNMLNDMKILELKNEFAFKHIDLKEYITKLSQNCSDFSI